MSFDAHFTNLQAGTSKAEGRKGEELKEQPNLNGKKAARPRHRIMNNRIVEISNGDVVVMEHQPSNSAIVQTSVVQTSAPQVLAGDQQ